MSLPPPTVSQFAVQTVWLAGWHAYLLFMRGGSGGSATGPLLYRLRGQVYGTSVRLGILLLDGNIRDYVCNVHVHLKDGFYF